jgi:hypothetical protein
MKKIILTVLTALSLFSAKAQFSIGSDLSIVRQIGESKSFWGLAQSVQPSYGLTKKFLFYATLGYTSADKTTNRFTTNALADTITPKKINYSANTEWRTRQFATGIKYYFKGSYDNEEGLNVYGMAGIGVMSIKLTTDYTAGIDTSNYQSFPPYPGEGTVNKLSFDSGLGIEGPLGGNFFWYTEAKAWIPTDKVTSPYLLGSNKVMPIMVGAGLRVLFGHY